MANIFSGFLKKLKEIEKKVGRDLNSPVWSPRILDIDIVYYNDLEINSEKLKIPHVGVNNRDFLQFLLTEIGCPISEKIKLDIENYTPMNHYCLNPKLIGIVNVTPDSFSDANQFLNKQKAIEKIRQLYSQGAFVIEIGAQSTRPGYIEVTAQEEIARLQGIFEECNDINCIGLDSYFDDVIIYALKNPNLKWINDQKSQLVPNTIKKIADANLKFVTMLQGKNVEWFGERIKFLTNLGIKKENIVIDPGIGFGKTKQENILFLKNINQLKNFECEIMVGHSRKSFMTKFSSQGAANRDIETIAISGFLEDAGVDYLRVHNVQDHMRMFISKHIMKNKFEN